MTEVGDILHVDHDRAVEAVEVELADWPRRDGEPGTIRYVVVRTRPVKMPPLPADDPRRGINEKIVTSIMPENASRRVCVTSQNATEGGGRYHPSQEGASIR